MGDSNIGQLPLIADSRFQVECYPEARIKHAAHILKYKTPTNMSVNVIILSFGIHDRETYNPNLIKKPLDALFEAARDTFPNATIHMPLLNYSRNLPLKYQKNITQFNTMIRAMGSFIPRLDETLFETLPDGLRWTPDTAQEMLDHWWSFLGFAQIPS